MPTYHLNATQWLEADIIMESVASRPWISRPAISDVVNRIRLNCFTRASKTPTTQAIKKRYTTYFLGVINQSLVEQADAMMKLVALKGLILEQPLALEVQNIYFHNSKSALHTIQAIEHRYRSHILSWEEADEWMKNVSTRHLEPGGTRFRICQVAEHVKETFFPTDQLVRVLDVQDRYCQRFVKIENTVEDVDAYDKQVVIAESMAAIQTLPMASRMTDHLNVHSEMTTSPHDSVYALASQHQSPQRQSQDPQHSYGPKFTYSPAMQTADEDTLPPRVSEQQPHQQPSMNPYKRARHSSDSNDSTSSSSRSYMSSFTNFSWPMRRVRQQLRDSGFFSSISGASDRTSLLSRMSRLSVDVKLCLTDHSHLQEGSSCAMCGYPERNPKPVVYVAREYAIPQRAEDIDSDELDNGNLRCDANAKL